MADLNTMIAQGPPRMDFSPLSTLFDGYNAGRKARHEQDIWDARRQAAVTGADGKPDFAATARNLLDAGDIEGARQIAAMVKDMRRGAAGAATDEAAGDDEVAPRTTSAAVGAPAWPQIPFAAARALQADPSLRAQFDEKFGRGYAAIVLGNPAVGR